MSTIRQFSIFDMLKFNNVNLDILTETYSTNFYGKYIAVWGEYNVCAENSSGMIEGYVLGKVEGEKESETKKNWHGHVTAVKKFYNSTMWKHKRMQILERDHYECQDCRKRLRDAVAAGDILRGEEKKIRRAEIGRAHV